MTRRIVVISGKVATGKSTLAEGLRDKFGAIVFSTRALLEQAARRDAKSGTFNRKFLQEFGAERDRVSGGAWLADELRLLLVDSPRDQVVVIDAVRLADQLTMLRNSFGRTVVHIHLSAFDDDLADRFKLRRDSIDENLSYELTGNDPTERQVDSLSSLADLHINTSTADMNDVLVRCAAKIGILTSLDSQLVDVLVGGQYGSEGKGNLAYYLAPEYDVLLRVGGPNAGHKVPTDPVVTHRSLPSGALSNLEAKIFIGAGAVISPAVLRDEIQRSRVSPDRIFIDPQAMVISDEDVYGETALRGAIGSTGQGVGAALARKINGRAAADLRLARDTPELKQFVRAPIVDLLEETYSLKQRVLLEGTQGTGLSLHHGRYPYVTSRDTTAAGCLSESGIGINRVRKVVMVIRSYPIRVQGESGPMGREIRWTDVAERSGFSATELLSAEQSSVQKKLRRVAEFDWKFLRASAQLNTPTDIALTFADYLDQSNANAFRFDQLSGGTREFIEEIESVTTSPVSLISGRFTDRSVIDRRRWRGHVNFDSKKRDGSNN